MRFNTFCSTLVAIFISSFSSNAIAADQTTTLFVPSTDNAFSGFGNTIYGLYMELHADKTLKTLYFSDYAPQYCVGTYEEEAKRLVTNFEKCSQEGDPANMVEAKFSREIILENDEIKDIATKFPLSKIYEEGKGAAMTIRVYNGQEFHDRKGIIFGNVGDTDAAFKLNQRTKE